MIDAKTKRKHLRLMSQAREALADMTYAIKEGDAEAYTASKEGFSYALGMLDKLPALDFTPAPVTPAPEVKISK